MVLYSRATGNKLEEAFMDQKIKEHKRKKTQQRCIFGLRLSQCIVMLRSICNFFPCLWYECRILVSDRGWVPATKPNIQFVYVAVNHIKIDGSISEGTD